MNDQVFRFSVLALLFTLLIMLSIVGTNVALLQGTADYLVFKARLKD